MAYNNTILNQMLKMFPRHEFQKAVSETKRDAVQMPARSSQTQISLQKSFEQFRCDRD